MTPEVKLLYIGVPILYIQCQGNLFELGHAKTGLEIFIVVISYEGFVRMWPLPDIQ